MKKEIISLTRQHKLFYIHHFVIAILLHTMYNSYGIHIVNMYANILHKFPLPYNNHHRRYSHIYYFVITMVWDMLSNLLQLVHCRFHKLNGMHDNVHYRNIQLHTQIHRKGKYVEIRNWKTISIIQDSGVFFCCCHCWYFMTFSLFYFCSVHFFVYMAQAQYYIIIAGWVSFLFLFFFVWFKY